jgi:hypothetical protein
MKGGCFERPTLASDPKERRDVGPTQKTIRPLSFCTTKTTIANLNRFLGIPTNYRFWVESLFDRLRVKLDSNLLLSGRYRFGGGSDKDLIRSATLIQPLRLWTNTTASREPLAAMLTSAKVTRALVTT